MRKPDLESIDKCIPEIDAHRGVPPILAGGGRLIKTHEQYRKEYTKAVFLVRDPRDVVLSSYAAAVDVGLAPLVSKGDLDSFLLSFLKGKALQTGFLAGTHAVLVGVTTCERTVI